jgi:hypothetical protein
LRRVADSRNAHCRPHPAKEVYVTGTFDNWSKREKLEKIGDSFEKEVKLLDTGEQIFYKVGVELVNFATIPLLYFGATQR